MTAWTEIDWADVLGAAVLEVARSGPVGAGNERRLHRGLREASPTGGVTKALDTEGRLQDQASQWTRSPGGIDVVSIRSAGDGARALGVECKVGKPDEVLWDAIKLGQRCDEEPWNRGLEAAALVVEFTDKELCERRAVRWFDAAVTQVDTIEAIERWPEAWYGVLCGGRGIRPTSLPRTLKLGSGGHVRHPGGGSALCWRLVRASPVGADINRIGVDTHGWPPQVSVPDEWRRQIDSAAEKAPERPTMALRPRRVLDKPPDKTIAEVVGDAEGRVWADAWDNRETVPTSFRLSETDPTRYDVRRSKNDALACANPPERIPAWCSREVAEALARSGIGDPPQ